MERHEADMRRALELAERGWGRVSPNPLVGAVVRSSAGDVVGEGWHEGPGTPHAEAMALAMAAASGKLGGIQRVEAAIAGEHHAPRGCLCRECEFRAVIRLECDAR